jgi:NADP-dependent aldehyde dehydrogenase
VKAYKEKKGAALLQEGVNLVAESETEVQAAEGLPTVATVDGATFLRNPLLHQEVFGPYCLVVRCSNTNELVQIAAHMEGQLTSTIMATTEDLNRLQPLVDVVQYRCGRLILNSVPTGVEVCLSMHHGGPFPATTDARFTSVGADGIKRFARPVCFQKWSNEWLPAELKNENPLRIERRINGKWNTDLI